MSLLTQAQPTDRDKVIPVHRATAPIRIDGQLNDPDWETAEVFSFSAFYRVETPTDQQETKVRMLWDDTHLYVSFEAEDQFLTAREQNRDGEPYLDDCAEVFLIPTRDKINLHFGYEVNLYHTSNDFVFLNDFYQAGRAVIKSYDPEFEVASLIDGTLNDNSDRDRGWTMEFAIPTQALRTVSQFSPLALGSQWAFLLVRQDRNEATGDRRSTSTLFPLAKEFKDVHDPQYFVLMEFVE